MSKKLRFRFISVSMAAISIVLFVLIASINIANYHNVIRSADAHLSLIVENGGFIPMDILGDKNGPEKKPFHNSFSQETPFDTRYFFVCVSEEGIIIEYKLDNIASVSVDEAITVTQDLLERNKLHGFYRNFRYTAELFDNEDGSIGYQYFFVDCKRELQSFQTFLVASIAISCVGLLLFFLLVVLFSRITLRPVEESFAKQKRFITDASHEIKTPLTIIDANIEIIEMESGESEWTKSIRNQITRMTDLTNKMVLLSRMDEGNTSREDVDFSLSDAVFDTADSFVAVAQSKNKLLQLDISGDISYRGDEGQIRQVISLLLDNAIKYSTNGASGTDGDIRLSLKANGKNKIISVWNTTEEMPVGRKDELFERFYRSDASRNSKTGGHGIGLSVVYAIVQSHRGKISARSEDGKSLLITITL